MKWVYEVDPLLKEVEGGYLRQNPVIIRVNKFDEQAAKEFSSKMNQAHNSGQKIIPVVIDSYGGQVYSLMSMIADIKSSDLPVATIVQGKAMSCGAALFTCGEEGKRYMSKDSTVLIHDVSSWNYGKVEEVKAHVEETERLNQKVYRMMAQNCGKPDDYFLKIVHERGHADWYLDVDECLKHNIANHTRMPKFSIKISADVDFG
jgi:ATP-dependent protease ClpP protease subunit